MNFQFLPGLFSFVIRGHYPVLRIFTHLTLQEKIFLYQRTRTLDLGSTVVEIGSYLGASSCCLAAGMKEVNGRVVCVDTWKNEGMSEGPRDTYDEFLSNTLKYRPWIIPLRGPSAAIAKEFVGTADMLFLDGDHAYEAVKLDLANWLPKLRSGGWLALHDWGWAEGVKRAIAEIVQPIQIAEAVWLPNMYAARVDIHMGLPHL